MQDVSIPDVKRARRHDVIVNSTGVGTLGRVARWLSPEPIPVDGHITVVRPDITRCLPVVFGYAILVAQPLVQALGEGSTGQTELSRSRLAELPLRLPASTEAERIEQPLEALDDHAEALLSEMRCLAALREALLPPLLSGELRVGDAEPLVSEAI
jgi:type I restriction enzyme S subunit